MFRLHGSPISNFYNIAKLALMEKGLDFEEQLQPPSQDEAFLAKSPLGKIPVLEVKEGFISETVAIVEFLEDVYPEIPLYPSNAYERALVRRLCHMAEVYIDIPCRPLLVTMMTGKELADDRKQEVRQQLEKGARGIARVVTPSPWMFGDRFTAADIFFYYNLGLVAPIAKDQLDVDLYSILPGFDAWRSMLAKRDFVQQVDVANKAAMEAFLKRKGS